MRPIPTLPPDKKLWGGGPRKKGHKLVWQDAVAGSGLPMAMLGLVYVISARANGPDAFFVTIDDLVELLKDSPGGSRRQIERGIATLIASGWLRQVQRGGSKAGRASSYALTIPKDYPWPVLTRRGGEPVPAVDDGYATEDEAPVPAVDADVPVIGAHVPAVDADVPAVGDGLVDLTSRSHSVDLISRSEVQDPATTSEEGEVEVYVYAISLGAAFTARDNGTVNLMAERDVQNARQEEGLSPLDIGEVWKAGSQAQAEALAFAQGLAWSPSSSLVDGQPVAVAEGSTSVAALPPTSASSTEPDLSAVPPFEDPPDPWAEAALRRERRNG